MLRGGIVILDEGNRMSEKSWASLAPLLDNRRYVESIVAGIKIKAHPLFRLVATMNDDATTFDLPEYIHSRLQPQILIDFPERHEEFAILHENLPFGDEHILNYVTDFLQQAHAADERYTVRDGINIARFAMKLMHGEAERGAKPDRNESSAHRDRADARRRGLALCPSKLKSNPAAWSRGQVPLLPGGAGAAGVRRSNCAGCCWRRSRGIVAVELPGFLEPSLSAGAGAAAGDVGDSVSRRGRTTTARSMFPWSRAIHSPKRCARRKRSARR